ncbi:hypothetical protein OG875_04805 [Streptomyces sp. NBC_01498]|uniref:hypothetical protein n=1 Tax=Streptomyces sp. NBC_01498 TaxID=2975870 RepID=UPI002E7B5487|nr:hypothetical protein [Streptomyces sp. NBC_01498]WTL23976.1 hypothetical protein OG875_04805 [Streptomyces sp. NBC_01498]
MAAVELHVDNRLLDDFEAIRPKLNGHEIGRRSSPVSDDVTVLTMEMVTAPSHARTMEVTLRRVDDQLRVGEIHYWDEHGIFIVPEVPFREVAG